MSSRRIRVALAITALAGLAATSIAVAAGRHHGHGGNGKNETEFTAHLIGYNEVPATNSAGQADLKLTVGNNQLTFELTYSGLSGAPAAAHVHVGQPGVNGGVSFFFCGGGGKPACPAGTSSTPVTVTGTVAAADVQAVTAQGLPAGDLNAILGEIKAGFGYANVHTTNFPGGEIRGQVYR